MSKDTTDSFRNVKTSSNRNSGLMVGKQKAQLIGVQLFELLISDLDRTRVELLGGGCSKCSPTNITAYRTMRLFYIDEFNFLFEYHNPIFLLNSFSNRSSKANSDLSVVDTSYALFTLAETKMSIL